MRVGSGWFSESRRACSSRVDGFVDAAAAAVSALGMGRSSLVLELGLHHSAVTVVESGAQARRRRVLVSEQGGLIELYEAWLTFISTAMVKLTRFDPFTQCGYGAAAVRCVAGADASGGGERSRRQRQCRTATTSSKSSLEP